MNGFVNAEIVSRRESRGFWETFTADVASASGTVEYEYQLPEACAVSACIARSEIDRVKISVSIAEGGEPSVPDSCYCGGESTLGSIRVVSVWGAAPHRGQQLAVCFVF